jgi:PhzF family phenazine biosynthesis protein
MKRFAFKKIDAFVRGASRGNPAGCVYLRHASEITPDEMQRIARELKGFVNEVVYLSPEPEGCFLRYYSSECEVDFCGHGTVAAMYDYLRSNAGLVRRPEVSIRVKDRVLKVRNSLAVDDSVYITAPPPRHMGTGLRLSELAGALGMNPSGINTAMPPGVVNAGLTTLIVPVAGLGQCLALRPDQASLRDFCLACGIDIVLAFTADTASAGSDYRTRVFAPKYGYLEDPATGSGNSAFGYHLLRGGTWDGTALSIEQNGDRDNPNIVRLLAVTEEGQQRVAFGGGAVVRIEGEYLL